MRAALQLTSRQQPSSSQREALSRSIRQIVANVAARSLAGTKESTFSRDLDLRGAQEDEISWRISVQTGIQVQPLDWSYFIHVKDLVDFVELRQKGTAR